MMLFGLVSDENLHFDVGINDEIIQRVVCEVMDITGNMTLRL